ncbi:MAG: hypothetical protein HWQ38_24350 [Nostoc sp. NMS7]|uniref:hypothetical protein n=1 Tax=Nostoc sp. NMS7 TaxID=2815391 RepID=UPI0025E4354C|nr:hypothetical protein [Nostoc sp. NMS7]MBN3949425.1 hypothetical protein [Nostoc sp. NMS7]
MKIINARWSASDDCVGAGNPETYVCDCSWPMPIDSEREESAAQIAAHIVRSHNWVLDLSEKQVPLDFLIEACDRVIERKALLTVTLGVIGDKGAEIADKQLKLIQQAIFFLRDARDLEIKRDREIDGSH